VTTPPRSPALTAAIVLGWAWAAVMGLLSLAAVVPALAARDDVALRALALLLAIASGAGSYLLRRGRWPHLALGAASAWIAYLVLVPLRVSAAGMAVNVLVLGLVLTSLRRFR
jgi:hypothetical protein